MANGTISQISFEDAPDMIALLLCATLFKLGGQITLTLGEIEKIHREYPNVRFALGPDFIDPGDPAKERLTCTLLSRDFVENDRPKE